VFEWVSTKFACVPCDLWGTPNFALVRVSGNKTPVNFLTTRTSPRATICNSQEDRFVVATDDVACEISSRYYPTFCKGLVQQIPSAQIGKASPIDMGESNDQLSLLCPLPLRIGRTFLVWKSDFCLRRVSYEGKKCVSGRSLFDKGSDPRSKTGIRCCSATNTCDGTRFSKICGNAA